MPSPRSRPRRTPPRADAGARRWLSRVAAVLALLAPMTLSTACGSGARPAPPQEPVRPQAQPFAPEEQAYLVDPFTGYPREVDAGRRERLESAHRALLTASDRAGASATAAELLAEDPSFAPAQVLAAQVELGDREYVKVITRLLPVSDEMPQYVASQLALGRAAELAGDVSLAYSAFREIATRSQRAFQRVGELHPRAVEIVANRLEEAVRQNRLAEADEHLALLRAWAPSEVRTLEGERLLAVARGDRVAELAAVK